MTDTDPRCAKCGHKRSQHHYRHPFVGPSVQTTIAAQADTIKALVEAIRQLRDRNNNKGGLRDTVVQFICRSALKKAAAKETT